VSGVRCQVSGVRCQGRIQKLRSAFLHLGSTMSGLWSVVCGRCVGVRVSVRINVNQGDHRVLESVVQFVFDSVGQFVTLSHCEFRIDAHRRHNMELMSVPTDPKFWHREHPDHVCDRGLDIIDDLRLYTVEEAPCDTPPRKPHRWRPQPRPGTSWRLSGRGGRR
jgi:hypothetical protein